MTTDDNYGYRPTAFWTTAEYVPVTPGPLDTAAIWGSSREQHELDGARPHLSPGRPPWEPEEPGRRRNVILIVIGLVLIVGTVFGVIVQRADVLPHWVPLIGKDTGVAACEALASGDKLSTLDEGDGRVRSTTMSKAEYQRIRAIFSDSRYPEIRGNGQVLIDYAWQLQGLGEDAGLAALPLLLPMTQAYTGLATGCAGHGAIIPAMGT